MSSTRAVAYRVLILNERIAFAERMGLPQSYIDSSKEKLKSSEQELFNP